MRNSQKFFKNQHGKTTCFLNEKIRIKYSIKLLLIEFQQIKDLFFFLKKGIQDKKKCILIEFFE